MSRSLRVVRAGFAVWVALVGLAANPAGAAVGVGAWIRPVDGPVVRGFDRPDSPFGPGHLGVDFAVSPGTPVRAAGDGVVVFAGRVGAALHVVTKHQGDLRTSDSFLASITVVTGQAVRRGAVLGTSGGTGAGHGAGVLHFGVREGDTYVDPMLLFAPPDLAAVVHLAEPRSAAASDPSSSGDAFAERAALAAELRIDGRTVLAPPPWWNDALPVAGPGRAPARAAPAASAFRTRPASGSPGPVAAVAAVATIPVVAAGGAVAMGRRRRRGPSRAEGPPTTLRPGPGAPGLRNLARRPAGVGPKPTDDTRP